MKPPTSHSVLEDTAAFGSDFGEYLRGAREACGMELDELALRTRIRRHWLELIEGCRIEELPAEVFLRGFVRSYARTVGADETRASAMLSRCIAERAPVEEAPLPLVDALRDLDAGGRRRMGVALAVIVLLIAATLMVSALWRRPPPAAGPISQQGPSAASRSAG